MKEYKRLTNHNEDLYDEKGTVQLSFFVSNNRLYGFDNLTTNQQHKEERKKKIENQILSYLQKLQGKKCTLKEINSMIILAKYLLDSQNKFSIDNVTNRTKKEFIQFLTNLLNLLRYRKNSQEKFLELSRIFFQKENQIRLNYNPDKEYPDLDQATIGLIRSDYLLLEHLNTAKALKKENKSNL